MILSAQSTAILAKLADEAGTDKWWTAVQIKKWINEIYTDIAFNYECLSTRDTTLSTTVGLARYVIPKPAGVGTITRLKSCDYDVNVEGTLDFYTIEQLDSIDPTWRGLGNSTPWGAFFEHGDENLAVSLIPAPGAIKVLGFDYNFIPSILGDNDEPYEPFKDGIILRDGVMSLALAGAGGGRDLDRSDYYFSMFVAKLPMLAKHKAPVSRGFKSIEDATSIRGPRLPSNYPHYPFGD
jgi:hypothetical protein